MSQIMGQADRLGEGLVQCQRPGRRARNLRHFDRMGDPRAVQVALVIHENLRLVHQTPERIRMDDAVPVPLEFGAEQRFWFRDAASPGAARRAPHKAPAPR